MLKSISRPMLTCLPLAFLWLGGCAVAPGYTEAELDIKETLESSKYQPASRTTRDNIETQELFAQAAFWSREYELNPGDLESAIKLSSAVRKLGNPQRAVEIAQVSRALYPRDPYLTAEFAAALIAMERADEAIKPLDEALRTAPGYARLWSLKGAALDQNQNYDLARRHYARALQITPNDPNIMANVGLSFALSGDPQTAEGWLRRAVAVPGASKSVRQNLALVLQLQGKTDEASKYANQAPQLRGAYKPQPQVQPQPQKQAHYTAPRQAAPQANYSAPHRPAPQANYSAPRQTAPQANYSSLRQSSAPTPAAAPASVSSFPASERSPFNYSLKNNYSSGAQLAGRNTQPVTASDAARLAGQQSKRGKVTIPLGASAEEPTAQQLSVLEQISKNLGPKASSLPIANSPYPQTAPQQSYIPSAAPESQFNGYPTASANGYLPYASPGAAQAPERREEARRRR